jgi:putative CocE/NonD family hydrolase
MDNNHGITIDFDAPARMRDGTVLRANIYRPQGAGPWPTLLTRLPYGKDLQIANLLLDPVLAARRGFIVVVQDTRGRYSSDGAWEPFRFEGFDGYDSVEWAARLPGSNGRVGMYGASYFGNSQWMAALERPPSLAAISPAFTWADPMDGLFGRGGAVELGLVLPWSLQQGVDYIRRQAPTTDEAFSRIWALVDDFDKLEREGYWQLPVSEAAVLARHGIPDLGSIRAVEDESIATSSTVAGKHERVTVPTLHTGGWYDIFLQGTLDNHAAMVSLGRPSSLVVGPWTHGGFVDPIGEGRFGLRASRTGVPVHPDGDLNDLELAWLGKHLTAAESPAPGESFVRVFVMGRNEWRDERTWPPAGTRSERHFLRADGTLSLTSPGSDEEPSEFTYDPADPVATIGGALVMSPSFPAGAFDQTSIETRDDVLIFTSAPLQAPIEVAGRVTATLSVQSSAPATDWVMRLCQVFPDGRSVNLCDGIARISSHADRAAEVRIDLWSTCNVFDAGHRIRVQVTSSNFPRWDRNLNTGDQQGRAHLVARQRLYHDASHPSYIELPTRHD